MSSPFPANPAQVFALTVNEFTSGLDLAACPSLDDVCGRFGDDANRAFVWLLRYRALDSLRANLEIGQWLKSGAHSPQDISEVAACHVLNERWEFDAFAFCAAVEALAARRR